jgi:predicted MFS family arabinose efflux permease
MALRIPTGTLAVLGFAFAVEGALYSAVTPILPLLSRRLDMSESQAGLMLSSYSAGLVAGSLLCVLILRRFSPREVAAGVLLVLAISTVVFAWWQDFGVAVASRLVQGIAGGATWTACITWLLRLYPIEQRGEALGLAAGPALVGTIAGPAIGTVALEVGVRGPYTIVATLCLSASLLILRMPRPPRAAPNELNQGTTPGVAAGGQRRLALLGAFLLMVAGALMGLLNVAGPIELVALGAAERTAGVLFLTAAIVTVVVARPMGLLVDRHGAARMVMCSLLVIAGALLLFGLQIGVVVAGTCVVVALLGNNLSYIASSTILTSAGERAGRSLSFVTAVTAVLWGFGETVGAVLAGLGLDTAGPGWTSAAASGLAASMIVVVLLVVPLRQRAERSVQGAGATDRPAGR